MGLAGTRTRYGRVAVALHWSIAALVVVALGSGLAADDAGAGAHGPLRVHLFSGLAAGVLTVARVLWWWLADTRPEPVADDSAARRAASRVVHALLVLLPLGMVASGVAMMALSGAADPLFAGGPLPDFADLVPRGPHGLGSRLLIGLVVLHVAAALFHQFALRDGLIGRMAWGRD